MLLTIIGVWLIAVGVFGGWATHQSYRRKREAEQRFAEICDDLERQMDAIIEEKRRQRREFVERN